MVAPSFELDHLLVRAPNWVGDLVMSTPVLEAACADPRLERVSIAGRAHLADGLAERAVDNVRRNFSKDTMCARTLDVYNEVLHLKEPV